MKKKSMSVWSKVCQPSMKPKSKRSPFLTSCGRTSCDGCSISVTIDSYPARATRCIPARCHPIVPVYNRPAVAREAVASVLAQTHRPIEIIVVDDGSTDNTGAVVDALTREHPEVLRAIHIPNGGPGHAREAGRALTRGEFVQY